MSNLFIAAALTYCFIVITLAPALSTASLQCDIQNLAPVIGHHCRLSDRPNIVCCDALVDAMDGIGGGGPCVCLISTHPAVKLSFNMLLRMYISCGGLRPGIVGQLANSCPAGLLRPSPPPPPAATLPSPPPPPPPPPATLSPSSPPPPPPPATSSPSPPPPPPPPPATSSPSPPPPPALPQSTCSSYSATKEGTTCSKKIDISMMASAELDTTEWDIMSHPYSKTFIQWGRMAGETVGGFIAVWFLKRVCEAGYKKVMTCLGLGM